ncbi:hypothetical protein V6Z12_A10G022100 [Gossypium hirsutum]
MESEKKRRQKWFFPLEERYGKKRNCVFHVLMLDALLLEEYQIGCKQKRAWSKV